MGGLPGGQRRECWNWTWVQVRKMDIWGQEPCESRAHWLRVVSYRDCHGRYIWDGVGGGLAGKEPRARTKSVFYHLCQGTRTMAHTDRHAGMRCPLVSSLMLRS